MTTTQALSVRQQRFVEEYLVDGNATQAARRAGYHPDNGRKMLREPAIAEAVSQAVQEQYCERRRLQQQVIERLKLRAFYDPRDLIDWGPDGVTLKDLRDLPPELAACVDIGFTFKTPAGTFCIKLSSPQAALHELTRILGVSLPVIPLPEIDDTAPEMNTRDWINEEIYGGRGNRLTSPCLRSEN